LTAHGARIAGAILGVGALAGALAAQGAAVPAGAEQVAGGRFTFVAMPGDRTLARSLLAHALATDTFPGLPRPTRQAVVYIAPDEGRFREWIGAGAPEWGIAVAFPDWQRVVMHGHSADARAGNPRVTLRHELAHLALWETDSGRLPTWFDEGYASFAAGEWSREESLASNIVLAFRGVPTFAGLDSMIAGGSARAEQGYALAHRAVADLAALDPRRGLSQFFAHFRDTRQVDAAMRRAWGVTYDGFEAEWRRSVRRRYGLLAVVANVGFASLVLFLVVAPFWIARRRRDRARLAAMVAADALAERRDRESALAALIGEVPTKPLQGGEQSGGNEDQIKER
jgi:hypothetical protein